IYIRFPLLTSYLLNYDVPVDDELIENLASSLAVTNIRLSPSNNYALLVRDENFIPSTIAPTLVNWNSAVADPGGPLTALWHFTELSPFHWFKVTSYRKLTGKEYSTSDRAYTTQERYLQPVLDANEVPQLTS